MEKQNQAIQKQEEERRRKEADLLRQQQIALMEAQREEQQKRMREQAGKVLQTILGYPFYLHVSKWLDISVSKWLYIILEGEWETLCH